MAPTANKLRFSIQDKVKMRKGEALLLASKNGDLMECERLVNEGAKIETLDKKVSEHSLQVRVKGEQFVLVWIYSSSVGVF